MILASHKFRELMFGEIAELFVKVELLDKNENVIKSIETKAVDGSVDVDKNRDVRRTFSLKLDNENNEFTWSPGGEIWLDKRIRLFVSYDQVEWVSIGVFILDNPSADSSHTGERYAELAGGDKWKLLDGSPIGKFTNVLTIPAGTPIADAIKLIASAGGIDKILFDPCDKVTPYTLNYESGDARGKAIKELADFANYDIGFDNNGYLRFKPNVDLDTAPVVETYDKSFFTPYAGSKKTLDTAELYNKVLVIGGNNQTGPVSAVAVNDDPNNPISTVNIGERIYIWRGDSAHLITTKQEAQDRADYELMLYSKVGEVQEIELLPNYLHEPDDVIRLVDDWTSTDDKYLIERFNIPLKVGDYMQIGARRVMQF